jgi:uncharacterized protein
LVLEHLAVAWYWFCEISLGFNDLFKDLGKSRGKGPDTGMTAPKKPPSAAAPPVDQKEFFWKQKTLEQMSATEWESLCDGCGRCCLEKLEDEDNGKIYFTSIACRLLDSGACACRDYENRSAKVPDCVRLTPANVRSLSWLPPSCGYRLVAEGRDLYWWHPLISGDPDSTHKAGVSVRGRVSASEADVDLADFEDYIVKWPGLLPKGARGKAKAAPAQPPANVRKAFKR